MAFDFERRKVVKAMAALGVAAVAPGLGGAGLAFAQSRSIAATTYPGAWEEAHRSFLVPAYRKATSNAEVNLIAAISVETVSKVLAARNNPPYDVMLLDEGPYLNALEQGIFEKIPTEKMPNLKDIPKHFIDSRGYGVFCSGQIIGIAYNSDRIKNPPRSWNDLLKPEYKGRVGLTGMGPSLGTVFMVEIARMNGGSESNLDPAFAWLKKLVPNIGAVAPNPGALATLFQQGQVDISVHYHNNVGDMQAKGVPIALARPETGWVVTLSSMNIVKNSKNVDLAAAYINAAISPEVQGKMGDAPYILVPTNPKVPLSKALQYYARDAAELGKMNTIDWAKINPRRQEYIDRFNREIKT
jgi:putative spermidine/putrescine transport system substrate-binding protein